MDDQQAEKHLLAHQTHPERRVKMIALSSRPIRAIVLSLVVILIYWIQPFNTKGQLGNHKISAPSVSWPQWAQAGKQQSQTALDPFSPESVSAGEGGPRIRQATMIYDTDKFNAVYERSVDTHIKHGKMWNIPTHVLRHDIVDAGFFNKPAFLLGLVIEEMGKPYGQRADWIVYASVSLRYSFQD